MGGMNPSVPSLAHHLLVAVPSLQQPPFTRSVTLVCQQDEKGAMGVVVNQPSEFTLGDVLSQLDISCTDADLMAIPVLNGGPVHAERGFVIHDDPRPWASTLEVGQGLYLTTSRDILQSIAQGQGPDNAVVTLGCAGWGPGQLEQELMDNSWLAVPAGREIIFDVPLAQRWQAAAGLIGVDLSRLTDYSGRV